MNLPMPNARTGEVRNFFVVRVWATPASRSVAGLFLSAAPNKEKQKEKQKRHHDNGHQDHEAPDEATLDEDSVPGEAERPTPPSEKPEACQK